jgi:hypothetical protein
VHEQETRATPGTDQSEASIHADDVGTSSKPRTSKSSTRAERESGAIRGGRERATRRSGLDEDSGSNAPTERPPGNLFDDPNAPVVREGKPLTRPQLNDDAISTIESNARRNATGQFVDENGQVITDPHRGHRYGHENRRILAAAEDLRLTQQQVKEYVNNRPEFFKIEEAEVNLSHRDEMPGLEPYDHIIDDMISFFNL